MPREKDLEVWAGRALVMEICAVRFAEMDARAMGQFDRAVALQQYADALAARGEVYPCEMIVTNYITGELI